MMGRTERSTSEALLRSYIKEALECAREALDAVEAGAPLWQSTEPLRAAISQLEEALRDAK